LVEVFNAYKLGLVLAVVIYIFVDTVIDIVVTKRCVL
jgi:hypothetical protein